MSVLDGNIDVAIPITEVSNHSFAELGFAQVAIRGKFSREYERVKGGYKMRLSIATYSPTATLNIAKLRRVNGKTKCISSTGHPVKTIDDFLKFLKPYLS